MEVVLGLWIDQRLKETQAWPIVKKGEEGKVASK